jgi:hypothetical protein
MTWCTNEPSACIKDLQGRCVVCECVEVARACARERERGEGVCMHIDAERAR